MDRPEEAEAADRTEAAEDPWAPSGEEAGAVEGEVASAADGAVHAREHSTIN